MEAENMFVPSFSASSRYIWGQVFDLKMCQKNYILANLYTLPESNIAPENGWLEF